MAKKVGDPSAKLLLCPHCRRKVPARHFGCHFASNGGKASRRKLTPAQAKNMVAKREQKRRKNSQDQPSKKKKPTP